MSEQTRQHRTLSDQAGELAFRKLAAFGEPEKIIAMSKDRIAVRRTPFQGYRDLGVTLGLALEIGADIADSALFSGTSPVSKAWPAIFRGMR